MYIYWFVISGIIRDTDEQPDKDLHTVRSGRTPGTRASAPKELGCTAPPAHECVRCLDALPTLQLRNFYGGFITQTQ